VSQTPTIDRNVLREQIKDVILGRILDGKYAPGSRLVETRIARELEVSQNSVREALRDLEHLGCVLYEPYRGCSVKAFSTAELLEAFPVRRALEELAARMAAENMTEDELGELARYYEEMMKAAEDDDPHRQSQVDTAFHAAIVHGSANATLQRQWSLLEPLARTYITLERSVTDLVPLCEEHLPVLRALQDRQGQEAASALGKHFTHTATLVSSASED
jgi:DNA-binding GntR family transcriptional regulator